MTPPDALWYLGIDIGTSGTKTLALCADDLARVEASASYPLLTPRPGWVEQDPTEWWKAVCDTTRRVVDSLPRGPRSVVAVGLSGHMSSVVTVDRRGNPLRPCMTVADGRGGEEAEWLATQFGPRIVELTGMLPTTSHVAPKLLWLRAHEPETYARMATFVAAKDHIRFLLTGRLATEATDAGNTAFLDVVRRQWDVALIADMGLDPAKLPSLVEPTDVVGGVTRAAAAATGLFQGTPVVAGAADMAASVVGTAATAPGIVAVTIGTSAQVTTPVRAPLTGARRGISFHPHAQVGWLYAMGSIFSGGLTLRWLAHALGEERKLTRLGDRYFEELSDRAQQSEPGSGGVLFLPFLVGAGSPDFDPAARAGFIGLSLTSGRNDLVRAALEGVAYNARDSLDAFRELGVGVERIHLGGGGSASAVWRDIIAAVLGMPVHPVRVRSASALGAAAIAAVGVGAYRDVTAAANSLVQFNDPIEPPEGAVERYERDYPAYVAARVALREIDRARASHGREPRSRGLRGGERG